MNSFRMIFKYWLRSRKFFILEFTYLVVSTVFYMFSPIFIGRMVGGFQSSAPVRVFIINFSMVLLFASLIPRLLTNSAFREWYQMTKIDANQIIFEREIFEHYRIVFEKVADWYQNVWLKGPAEMVYSGKIAV